MKRNDSRIAALPVELQLLIMSKTGTAKSITNLMQVSKNDASAITNALRNPASLLHIITSLPPAETSKLIYTHFSSESENYHAIKKSAEDTINHSAVVCFALITDYSPNLDWLVINRAMTELKKQNIAGWDMIQESLQLMQNVISKPDNIKKFLNDKEAYINLSGVDFRIKSDFISQIFEGAKLKNINLQKAILIEKSFSNLHTIHPPAYEETTLININFRGSDLYGAKLAHLQLSELDLSKAILERADLCMANLSGAKLREANLINANLTYANLNNADLSGAVFCGPLKFHDNSANLANLSHTTLLNTNLNGATFFYDFDTMNVDQFKLILTKLDEMRFDYHPDSKRIIRKAALDDIITNLQKKELLQVAYEHPYFSHHENATKAREFINTSFSKLFSYQGTLVETASQTRLKEKMEKLDLVKKAGI